MKCDFCEKDAIGYTSMQAAIYCDDHKEKAEKIEAAMWKECDKIEQELREDLDENNN